MYVTRTATAISTLSQLWLGIFLFIQDFNHLSKTCVTMATELQPGQPAHSTAQWIGTTGRSPLKRTWLQLEHPRLPLVYLASNSQWSSSGNQCPNYLN
jgi:hypothetical protein